MRKDVAEAWVKRLRSGDYEQGQNRLRTVGKDGVERLCCLGVLSDMAVEAGAIPEPDYEAIPNNFLGIRGHYRYDHEQGLPPGAVNTWSGFETDELFPVPERLKGRFSCYGQESLFSLNDNGATFAEIADLIEARYIKGENA